MSSNQQQVDADGEEDRRDDDIDIEQYRSEIGRSETPTFDVADDEHALRETLGSADVREWQFPAEEASERFAELYERHDAFVREDISNAETACIRRCIYELQATKPDVYTDARIDEMGVREIVETARRETDYEPVISIVHTTGGADSVRIEDNGIGMSVEEFEVLRNVGFSATHSLGVVADGFGMGVLSNLKSADRVEIETVSRRTDERFGTYMLKTGFKDLPTDRSRYGTTFTLTLNAETRERVDVAEAVERYGTWTMVPVRYEEYNASGERVDDEEYPARFLEDAYDDLDTQPSFVYEDDYVRLLMSPLCSGRTLNISQPIERNDGAVVSCSRYDWDVRVKDERGVIVDGPNEGLVPVSDSDYRDLLLDAREPYVPADYLNDGIVVGYRIPEDTGTVSIDGVDVADATGAYVVPRDTVREHDRRFLQERDDTHLIDTDVDLGPDGAGWTPVVVTGVYEGRQVVGQTAWSELPDGETDDHIRRSELHDDDVVGPQPTGDRDRYEQGSDAFWDWCADRLTDRYRDRAAQLYERVDGIRDIVELDAVERELYFDARNNLVGNPNGADAVADAFDNQFGVSIDEQFARQYSRLDETITVAKRDTVRPPANDGQKGRTVWRFINDVGDANVFMAVSPNLTKCQLVWDAHPDNQVVIVDSTDEYDVYERRYGWERLKDLDLYDLEDSPIADDLDEELFETYSRSRSDSVSRSMWPGGDELPGPSHLDPRTKELTVYMSDKHTQSLDAGYLGAALHSESFTELSAYDGATIDVDRLALFPTTASASAHEYTWMTDSAIAVADSPKYVCDYLSSADGVSHWLELLEEHKQQTIRTAAGPKSAVSLRASDVFVVPDPDRIELFRAHQDELLDVIVSQSTLDHDVDEACVTVLDPDDNAFWDARLAFEDPGSPVTATVVELDGSVRNLRSLVETHSWRSVTDMTVYAELAVPDGFEESTVFERAVSGSNRSWDEATFDVLRTLERLDQFNQQPASLDDE